MSSIKGSNDMIRIDTSRANEYLYADKPKLSFWQKLGRGAGKIFSFLGPIGAAVIGTVLPGVGLPIAMGTYGLSKLAGDLTNQALGNDQAKMSAYNAEVSNLQVSMPGLFEQASSADITADFMTPQEYSSSIISTIADREVGSYNQVEGFQFY
jgi:hypothetical protein